MIIKMNGFVNIFLCKITDHNIYILIHKILIKENGQS